MITTRSLEELKQQDIDGIDVDDLTDISNIVIDENKTITERISAFVEQISNPYLFKVGNTPVKVNFSQNAPSIQKCLESLFIKNI